MFLLVDLTQLRKESRRWKICQYKLPKLIFKEGKKKKHGKQTKGIKLPLRVRKMHKSLTHV